MAWTHLLKFTSSPPMRLNTSSSTPSPPSNENCTTGKSSPIQVTRALHQSNFPDDNDEIPKNIGIVEDHYIVLSAIVSTSLLLGFVINLNLIQQLRVQPRSNSTGRTSVLHHMRLERVRKQLFKPICSHIHCTKLKFSFVVYSNVQRASAYNSARHFAIVITSFQTLAIFLWTRIAHYNHRPDQ